MQFNEFSFRIHRLFDLCDPPVNAKRRGKVATLLHLYLASKKSCAAAEPAAVKRAAAAFGQSKIYSVEMLDPRMKESNGKAKSALDGQRPAGNDSPPGPAQVIDEWTLCSGNCLGP